jgi:hypothetical protein
MAFLLNPEYNEKRPPVQTGANNVRRLPCHGLDPGPLFWGNASARFAGQRRENERGGVWDRGFFMKIAQKPQFLNNLDVVFFRRGKYTLCY